MLICRAEAPEWDSWMPGSLPGQGRWGTGRSVLWVHSIQPRVVKWTLWVTLGTSILGGWPLFFSLEQWIIYTVHGVWLPAIHRWRVPIVSVPTGRNRRPVVPWYFTPTVAPVPSIEQVAKMSHQREVEWVLICFCIYLVCRWAPSPFQRCWQGLSVEDSDRWGLDPVLGPVTPYFSQRK
jgi:hypothetical protein